MVRAICNGSVMLNPSEIRAIGDPMERAKKAVQVLDSLRDVENEVSRIRRSAIEELIGLGKSQASVAEALGVSRGRVSQILKSGPPAERLFFGEQGTVRVLFGAKQEAGKPAGSYALAHADHRTLEALKALSGPLALEMESELVEPPGMVNLSRDNIFCICGPRLSPVIQQVLETDPYLGFVNEGDAWHLVDKQSGKEFRSPQDGGEPGDVAYFGRLPRLDGRGTFLYAAGIHASGPRGVVHYLNRHLTSLFKDIGTQRFSTLIACRWDDNGEISESKRVAEMYLHDHERP